MENKNIIVALVLMIVVWLGFTLLFPPQPPMETTGDERQAASDIRGQIAPSEKTKEPLAEDVRPPSPPIDVRAREITVENKLYKAVFTNSGARLKSFVLKNYKSSPDPDSPRVSIVDMEQGPFSTLRTTGEDGFMLPPEAMYSVDAEGSSLFIEEGETRKLVFRYESPNGIIFEKIYTLYGDRYPFDLEVRTVNRGGSEANGSLEVSIVHPWDDEMAGRMYEHVGPTTFAGGEIHTTDVDDLANAPEVYRDQIGWTAFETKYFMGAAVPLDGAGERVLIRKEEGFVENIIKTPHLTLAPGESAEFDYFLYFGPRDLDVLEAADYQLAEAVDFGFFSPISKPLLYVLKFFYSFVGNYGVAIILLTVIIKLIFWPLTHKSYASMKNMQKLQPEMQKVREKNKNNREKMNREIMELYKTHRVNPLGGCLPMVIQIPVFFALYKVLLGSIELRHAPFFLWITDLSAKDPYYVTPLIMGATMFLQQKMSPTTMDPTQAKIFMLMPVIFTVMFLNFPAGLVLYWLINNLLTIAQQVHINRKN